MDRFTSFVPIRQNRIPAVDQASMVCVRQAAEPRSLGVDDVSFFALPPEINSLRMFLGAGSTPLLQASAAWSGLAEELSTAADSFASVTANLAGQAWQGPAASAMAAAAAPYSAFLQAASARAFGASGQARAVASAFEAAKAATIHPEVIAANRRAFVQLVRTNFFGFNAPFIAASESLYGSSGPPTSPR